MMLDRVIPATMGSAYGHLTSLGRPYRAWAAVSPTQEEHSMTTVGSGKYTYTVIQDWAKLPPGETFAMVSAVATDSHDRVYGFQRKDPPIVIFDREGT